MSQKLPVNNFEWIKNISQCNKYFIKNYNEESHEGYFLEVNVQYLHKSWFAVSAWKNENWESRKLNTLYT